MKIILEHIRAKIFTLQNLAAEVAQWKAKGEKIVFTNGVFDLVHPGHITYLAKAAELGDRLIIGVNADISVKRIKGQNRPVNNEHNRQFLLAALAFTDAVVLFTEDTPAQLINTIMPAVLVKGGDYKIENIVGADDVIANGGDVITINFVEGHSSTAIINSIKAQNE